MRGLSPRQRVQQSSSSGTNSEISEEEECVEDDIREMLGAGLSSILHGGTDFVLYPELESSFEGFETFQGNASF